jgi:hypothetical protein
MWTGHRGVAETTCCTLPTGDHRHFAAASKSLQGSQTYNTTPVKDFNHTVTVVLHDPQKPEVDLGQTVLAQGDDRPFATSRY